MLFWGQTAVSEADRMLCHRPRDGSWREVDGATERVHLWRWVMRQTNGKDMVEAANNLPSDVTNAM